MEDCEAETDWKFSQMLVLAPKKGKLCLPVPNMSLFLEYVKNNNKQTQMSKTVNAILFPIFYSILYTSMGTTELELFGPKLL